MTDPAVAERSWCGHYRREVCLLCPGYEEPGYPHGKAWHRYRPKT